MKELRAIAKNAGVQRYTRFRKAELLEVLADVQPENLPVRVLRIISKKLGTRGYAKMRKTELINAVRSTPGSGNTDSSASESNIPIFKPPKPTTKSVRSSLRKAVDSAKKEIKKFTDWLLSYISDSTKRTVSKRLKKLQKKASSIFNKPVDYFIPKEHETALKGFLKTYMIKGRRGYDPTSFLKKVKPEFYTLIRKQRKPLKVKCIFSCHFIRRDKKANRITEETDGHFHSLVETITAATNTFRIFDKMAARLIEMVHKYENERSEWVFDHVIDFRIHINPFRPFSGTSYIPLPPELAAKKAIINVKNEEDQECFKWAVTSAVFPSENHPERRNKEMRENSEKFDWSGIEFPVAALGTNHIDKFERQNSYGINVLGYENNEPTLIRRSNKLNVPKINLLLISTDETNHYCWIKNISRLIRYNKHKEPRYYCDNCLNSFYSEKSLETHREYCLNHEAVKVEMPMNEDGSPKFITFKNRNRKMQVPFVVYADFECFTEKMDTCSPDERESFTNQYQKHKPSGFCYLIKCSDDDAFEPMLVMRTANSSEEDIPKMFQESLEADIKEIYNQFKFKKSPRMSMSDERKYEDATHCHICEGELGKDKVLDHCHLTGR